MNINIVPNLHEDKPVPHGQLGTADGSMLHLKIGQILTIKEDVKFDYSYCGHVVCLFSEHKLPEAPWCNGQHSPHQLDGRQSGQSHKPEPQENINLMKKFWKFILKMLISLFMPFHWWCSETKCKVHQKSPQFQRVHTCWSYTLQLLGKLCWEDHPSGQDLVGSLPAHHFLGKGF